MSRQADSRITGGKRDGGQFPTTHWSLVLRAGDAASATGREALDALLRKYNAPLRVHLIRVRRITPDDAEDILQDFVAGKILRRGIVARARRADGRFRTFILTALDRFACSWYRARNAAKRRPQEMLPLDENAAAVAGSAGSGEAFDVAWAREVVNQAVQRMQAECSRTEIGRAHV